MNFGIEPEHAAARMFTLSPREDEVARLVCLGHGNKAIGRCLGISPKTADVHLKRIRTKLGVSRTYGIPRIVYAAMWEPE